MNTPRPLLVCAMLIASGCLPDPNKIQEQTFERALAAVSENAVDATTKTRLRAEANPWGGGIVLFARDADKPDEVGIWAYYNDGTVFSIPRRSDTEGAVAFNAVAAKLTPQLRTFASLRIEVQKAFGLDKVPKETVTEVVVYSLRHGTHLHDARAAVSRKNSESALAR